MGETGVPFDASKFVEALQSIYKHTHPPDEQKAEIPEVRKES